MMLQVVFFTKLFCKLIQNIIFNMYLYREHLYGIMLPLQKWNRWKEQCKLFFLSLLNWEITEWYEYNPIIYSSL